MNTAAIDPTAPPTERRYTTHLFRLDRPVFLGGLGAPPSGSPLTFSDTPEWPTPILFDAVYAGAILHHFGTQMLKDEVGATWKETFYPHGIMITALADCKVITDDRAATAERTQNQTQDQTLFGNNHVAPRLGPRGKKSRKSSTSTALDIAASFVATIRLLSRLLNVKYIRF
jgi:hypothetical protein